MNNPLHLSDEEFLKSSPDSYIQEEETEEEVEQETPTEEVESTEEESDTSTETESDEEEEDSDAASTDAANQEDESSEEDETSETNSEDKKEEETSVEEEKPTETSLDYKAEYERLLKPFKANGREVKVDSVDEAIQLMQMGANYTKKMAALKPSLKILRMLEDHGLMDEAKLSFLIDLEKRKPQAIGKLVKDSGIDPLDLDTENSTEYKPSSYTVDDKELELDAVLEKISSTSAYTRTIDVVSNKWDASSKTVLLNNPTLIEVINEHIEQGVYDQIASVMEKERMLGRLTNLSDLEAYKYVGDMLQSQGKFGVASQAPVVKKTVVTTSTKAEDPALIARKKAAGLTQTKTTKAKVEEEFNPLSLSDAEFEKYMANKKFV